MSDLTPQSETPTPTTDKITQAARETIYLCNFRVSVDGDWLCLRELNDISLTPDPEPAHEGKKKGWMEIIITGALCMGVVRLITTSSYCIVQYELCHHHHHHGFCEYIIDRRIVNRFLKAPQ